MIGISTVWTSQRACTGDELLNPLIDLGFEGIELEYRITSQIYSEILPRLRAHALRVLSIHNYFPVPDIISPYKVSGDCFSLSSLDQEERAKGVFYASRTIESAHDLEAQAVVLHLGRVETGLPREGLQKLYREGRWEEEGAKLFQQEQDARGTKRGLHLDALLFSLEKIVRRAERLGVLLGIENRYYHQEIPDRDELGIIFAQFRGGPIGYWHDVGHAAVLDTLGVMRHEELLQLYGPMMVGVHLHDALGVDDHKPPGQGEIAFEMIKNYIPDRAIKIIEIQPQAKSQEILDGLVFLKEKGIGP